MRVLKKNTAKSEDKSSFYPKVHEALKENRYVVYDNPAGKGAGHASKPDYVAVKGSRVVIGEIKSPAESPLSSSWRSPQDSDTPEFTAVRLNVYDREQRGLIPKEAGGHEIIIRGQITDYVRKLGRTYDLPEGCLNHGKLLGGYSAPASEAKNIEQAFSNCGKRYLEKILHSNGTVSYIFPL
jgi:hypothetical protein